MTQKPVIVVGGGPAGLMAAGTAAEKGAAVLLLEKMKRPARKLGITGKGRCNLTNTAELDEFMAQFGKNGRFLRGAFQGFFNTDLIDFMQANGVALVTERGGRVFPESGRALQVVSALTDWVQSRGVQIRTGHPVDELLLENERITGVRAGQTFYPANAVILATGGASYPATGSTGDGYHLAASVGHRIEPVRPALVPLESSRETTTRLNGLHLRNVGVKLLINGRKKGTGFGEVMFTDFGISGPVPLQLSGMAVDAIDRGDTVDMAIDLKPALDDSKLDARLQRDFDNRIRESIADILRGLLPRQLVPLCMTEAELPAERTGAHMTAAERHRLRSWLKRMVVPITGYRSFSEAIITAGGVTTREIDPRSMASRLVSGLYLVGELLDVQAHTGGYNLQAAFSTGWLAGSAAGRSA